MKKIHLHGPTARNDLAFVDAGITIDVGNGKTQISEDRAKDLVDRGVAVAEPTAPSK